MCRDEYSVLGATYGSVQIVPHRGRTKREKKRPQKSRFNVGKLKMKTLEEMGLPWYWVHNAWEARLQVRSSQWSITHMTERTRPADLVILKSKESCRLSQAHRQQYKGPFCPLKQTDHKFKCAGVSAYHAACLWWDI